MITPSGRWLGSWISEPDNRDHAYPPKLTRGLLAMPLPRRVDRRTGLPPCWNQASLGCCEGHGGAAKLWELYPGYMASRLAIYYWGRTLEGTVNSDGGMYTRSLMKVLQRGVLPETEWPYDIGIFKQEPPLGSTARGIASYSRLNGREEFLDYLAFEGSVIFSLSLPYEFDGGVIAAKGLMHWDRNASFVGAHCVLAVGYELDFRHTADFSMSGLQPDMVEDEMVLVRNSWGADWGIAGYFWMPLSWVINDVTGNDAWAVHVSSTMGPQVGGIPIQGARQ